MAVYRYTPETRYALARTTPRMYSPGTYGLFIVEADDPPLFGEEGRFASYDEAEEPLKRLAVEWEVWETWTPEQRRAWHETSINRNEAFINEECLHLWGDKRPARRSRRDPYALPRPAPSSWKRTQPGEGSRTGLRNAQSIPAERGESSPELTAKVFPTELFGYKGIRPQLSWWLDHDDLNIHGTELPWEDSRPGNILGAQCGSNWIFFHYVSLLQICSADAHSHWHRDYVEEEREGIHKTGIWEIVDSERQTTAQTEYTTRQFVIEFSDHIVEVVCRDLILGEGRFDIEKLAEIDHRFVSAFWHYAEVQRSLKHADEALEYYQKFIDHYTGSPEQLEEEAEWEEGDPTWLGNVRLIMEAIRTCEPNWHRD